MKLSGLLFGWLLHDHWCTGYCEILPLSRGGGTPHRFKLFRFALQCDHAGNVLSSRNWARNVNGVIGSIICPFMICVERSGVPYVQLISFGILMTKRCWSQKIHNFSFESEILRKENLIIFPRFNVKKVCKNSRTLHRRSKFQSILSLQKHTKSYPEIKFIQLRYESMAQASRFKMLTIAYPGLRDSCMERRTFMGESESFRYNFRPLSDLTNSNNFDILLITWRAVCHFTYANGD